MQIMRTIAESFVLRLADSFVAALIVLGSCMAEENLPLRGQGDPASSMPNRLKVITPARIVIDDTSSYEIYSAISGSGVQTTEVLIVRRRLDAWYLVAYQFLFQHAKYTFLDREMGCLRLQNTDRSEIAVFYLNLPKDARITEK